MAYTDINIPMTASATIVKGDVLEVSGDGTVAPAGAASVKVIGVAYTDAASGDLVSVITEGAVKLTAGTGGVTAGALIQVLADGVGDLTLAAVGDVPKAFGIALTTATATNTATVLLK